MPYCPDCGRHIALGDVQCPECGSRIGGEAPEGPTGPPAPSPERQEPQRPRPDSEERRRAITYAGGVLGLMVVGAVGMEALDERGPVDVVEEWRAAWVRGDETTYGELWHPGVAADPATWWADELGSAPETSLRYTSESRDVVEETATDAVVRETFLLWHPSFDERVRLTDVIDLRTADDSWRISGVRTESVATVSDCNRRLTITGRGRLDCE